MANGGAGSRLQLRLNGHTAAAGPVIEAAVSMAKVTQEGEWLTVQCRPEDKGRVLQALAAAGITILDFRLSGQELISRAASVGGEELH
jgi:hypothetical protein